jgi:hypothetical protein
LSSSTRRIRGVAVMLLLPVLPPAAAKRESRTLSLLRFAPHLTTGMLDDQPHEVQTEARPFGLPGDGG